MSNATNVSATTVRSDDNVTLVELITASPVDSSFIQNSIIIPTDVIIFLFVSVVFIVLSIKLWQKRTLSSVIVLKTPNSSDCHPYLITIVTSYLRGASSTSPRVSVRIIGSESSSGEYKVTGRNGLKEKPFQKGKLDMFYCNGPDNLGVLEHLEINQRGPDNWYVTCVSIQDLETKLWYRCKDSKWLRAEPDEEQIHQFALTTHSPPEGLFSYVMFYFTEQIGDMHIWMSLTQWQCPSYMPTFSRFLLCSHFLSSFMFFAIISRYADIYYGFGTGLGFILLAAVYMWIFEIILRLTEPRKIRRTPVRTVRSRDLLNTTVQSSASSMNSVCANAGIVKLPCFPSDMSAIAHVPDGWEQDDLKNKEEPNAMIGKPISGVNGAVGAEKEKLLPKLKIINGVKSSSPKSSGKIFKPRRPVPPPPTRKKQLKELNGNVPGESDNFQTFEEKQFVKKMPDDEGPMSKVIDDDYHRLSSDESIEEDSSMPDPQPKKSWGRMLWDPIINAYGRLSGALATEPEEVVVEMRKLGTPMSSNRMSIQPSLTASDLESFYTARNSWVSDDRSVSFASFHTGSLVNIRSLKDAASFEEFNSALTLHEENDFEGPIFATYMLESELLDIELEARNARHRPLPYFVHYISYIFLTCHTIGMFIATSLFGVSLTADQAVSWLASLFYAVAIELAILEVLKLIVCAFISYSIRAYYDNYKSTKCVQLDDNSVNNTTTTVVNAS